MDGNGETGGNFISISSLFHPVKYGMAPADTIVVVVLCGPIGSGKTTTLNRLKAHPNFLVWPEDVEGWSFYLSRYYQDPSADNFFRLQADVASHFIRVTRQLEECQANGGPDIPVVERSPLDVVRIFLQMGHDRHGYCEPSLIGLMRRLAELAVWRQARYIYLDLPIEQCLERIRRRQRPGEAIGIDEQYARQIDRLYWQWLNDGESGGIGRFTILNLSAETEPQEVVEMVIDVALFAEE